MDAVLEAIAGIEKNTFGDAWSAGLLEDTFRYDYNHLIYETDASGEVTGYVIYSLLDVAELQRIAVREDSRKRGIAGRLMDRFINEVFEGGGSCEALSPACDRIMLEVRSKNEPALSLYEKYGFRKVFVRKDYYDDPADDAVIMELEKNCHDQGKL